MTVLAHFGGFLVRGAFGFGHGRPIVVVTAWALGPHHAIMLVILTAMIAQANLFPQGVKRANWRLVGALVGGVYIGIAVGTYVFVALSPETLAPILGALVISIVAMDRLDAIGRLGRLVDLTGRGVVATLSTVSGFVGTVSGGGGIYFLAPFLKHMLPEPDRFRATCLVFSGVFLLGRTLFIAIAGLIDLTVCIEALLLTPAAFLGGWIGGRWFRRAEPDMFFRGLSLMLLVGAGLMIGRSVLA